MNYINASELLPKPPSFSAEELQRCKEKRDFVPFLFEWYKFVGLLASFMTQIQRASRAFRPISSQHYHVLVGLLNRCARLMLANVALSYEGRFGETTAIIDRCIFESGIKTVWLCENPTQEKFDRYLADGLKAELEFKQLIAANIASRGGEVYPIEQRMLNSISNSITASEMSEAQIHSAKKLPNLAAILESLGDSRLTYVVSQRMGSHHVHGTWSSLLLHYLDEKDGEAFQFLPRDADCETHINQFMSVPVIVLRALSAYAYYVIADEKEATEFVKLFESTNEEIMRIYTQANGGDLAN